MDALAVIILAAGQGKRLGQNKPKGLAELAGKSFATHILNTVSRLNPAKVILVTGFQRELLEAHVLEEAPRNAYAGNKISFAYQPQQLGTGDAVKAALPELKGFSGTVLILYGDSPLISIETLQKIITAHADSKATLSLLALKGYTDNHYGRLLRDTAGNIQKILEYKDCSTEQRSIDETNTGIYAVDSAFLEPAVNGIEPNNVQKEYYLTDIVERAAKEGQTVNVVLTTDQDEVLGINTPSELIDLQALYQRKRAIELIMQGATLEDPATCYIEASVKIGKSVRIGPNTIIKGNSEIADNVTIEGCCYLKDVKIAEGAEIKLSVRAESALIGKGASVGPFAHLRPGSDLGADSKVGNFVETKNAKLAAGAKASHLSYLGDCSVGAEANIGAGVITANYDGVKKHHTEIGERTFVGSNSTIIAPVKIGKDATVGAGSVINKDVEAGALALSRAELRIKTGWIERRPRVKK